MIKRFSADEKFRLGSSYNLLEWNRLSPQQQQKFAGLPDLQELYGIFEPVSTLPHCTAKIAYREVALLYLHLQTSFYLPHYLVQITEEKWEQTIARLVLDSILEIEYEGNFVAGFQAVKAIFGPAFFYAESVPGYLSVLSAEAIKYALLLKNLDVRSMAKRLYTFNTIPRDTFTKKKFYSAHTVKEFLFPVADYELHSVLNNRWHFVNASKRPYWLAWYRQNTPEYFEANVDKSTFKLYISPRIDDLPEVIKKALPVLSASNAFSFKVGSSVEGLLRPDKMVVYFEENKALKETSNVLQNELKAFSVHGVPFTKQADDTGLLSWGVDPPKADVFTFIESGSWRAQVTDQLALAIIQAQKDNLSNENVFHFINAKLSSAGINTTDWIPADFT